MNKRVTNDSGQFLMTNRRWKVEKFLNIKKIKKKDFLSIHEKQ